MKHRNQIRQSVPIFDKPKGEEGRKQIGEKAIFHEKKFSAPQYQSRRGMWDMLNKTAKFDHLGQPKSKRQRLLNPPPLCNNIVPEILNEEE